MQAKDIYLSVINNELNRVELVTILQLIANKLEINTISEMARLENKSPQGIRTSNKYEKIKIGKQIMVIKPQLNI